MTHDSSAPRARDTGQLEGCEQGERVYFFRATHHHFCGVSECEVGGRGKDEAEARMDAMVTFTGHTIHELVAVIDKEG